MFASRIPLDLGLEFEKVEDAAHVRRETP